MKPFAGLPAAPEPGAHHSVAPPAQKAVPPTATRWEGAEPCRDIAGDGSVLVSTRPAGAGRPNRPGCVGLAVRVTVRQLGADGAADGDPGAAPTSVSGTVGLDLAAALEPVVGFDQTHPLELALETLVAGERVVVRSSLPATAAGAAREARALIQLDEVLMPPAGCGWERTPAEDLALALAFKATAARHVAAGQWGWAAHRYGRAVQRATLAAISESESARAVAGPPVPEPTWAPAYPSLSAQFPSSIGMFADPGVCVPAAATDGSAAATAEPDVAAVATALLLPCYLNLALCHLKLAAAAAGGGSAAIGRRRRRFAEGVFVPRRCCGDRSNRPRPRVSKGALPPRHGPRWRRGRRACDR